MNILLDFLTFKYPTGAGEYARRVYTALLHEIQTSDSEVYKIYALYDSKDGIAYEDMQEGAEFTKGITYIDMQERNILQAVETYSIDLLFIGCAQYFEGHGELSEVKCKTICVVHDLSPEILYSNCIGYYLKLINPKYQLNDLSLSGRKYLTNTLKLIKWFFMVRKNRTMEKDLQRIKPMLGLLVKNKQTQIVTVSEYTRKTLQYLYGVEPQMVKVLYSPERIFANPTTNIENEELAELIHSKKKYYLMLSANRSAKNPEKAVSAFKRFAQIDNDAHFLAVGYPRKEFDRMHNPSYLNDSDLAQALEHCYVLVYPSLFEGFGYPPIEAMHYGKPVLASNVTSIPEIFEDAPIYFSPLYELEIFNALTKLTDENYQEKANKSKQQYNKIRARQERDLKELVNMILDK